MATFTVPSHTYQPGTTAFGPFAVPSGSQITVSLLRQAWPDSAGAEILSLRTQQSVDGGVTFPPELDFGFGCAGGVLPNDKNGQPVLSSSMTMPIQTPCQLKGSITLGEAITTTITITVT